MRELTRTTGESVKKKRKGRFRPVLWTLQTKGIPWGCSSGDEHAGWSLLLGNTPPDERAGEFKERYDNLLNRSGVVVAKRTRSTTSMWTKKRGKKGRSLSRGNGVILLFIKGGTVGMF